MEIPTEVVALLGIGAIIKYAYQIFYRKNYRNWGALISIIYLTSVYIALSNPNLNFHGSPFVRVGIVLIFLDKILVFGYDLFTLLWLHVFNEKSCTMHRISRSGIK